MTYAEPVPHQGERASSQTDTTPKAWDHYLERIRQTPPRARLARALELSRRARAATMADLKRQLPNATSAELAFAFLRRVYGETLAGRVAARLKAR